MYTVSTMESLILSVGLMIALMASPVLSFSTGAPSQACATLMPNHGVLLSQTSSSPFELDVSTFEDLTFREDRTYSYMPGVTYNRKLNTMIQTLNMTSDRAS